MARSTRTVALVRAVTPAQIKNTIRYRRVDQGGAPPVTDITLSNDMVVENVTVGSLVGVLASVPPGAELTLIDDGLGLFELDLDGNLNTAAPIDYESGSTVEIVVKGVSGGNEFTKPFTITVINENEIISVDLSANTLLENSAQGTVIGTLSSVPPGAAFAVVGENSEFFQIVGNSLQASGIPTNYEGAPDSELHAYPIAIEATLGEDVYGASFSIEIIDVVEITDITLSAAAIDEGSTSGTVVGTLASVPAGATWTLVNNAGNRFAITGNTLVAGAVATSYDTATSHVVRVRATRQGEEFEKNFTIQVNNVNSITDIALVGASVAENTASGVTVGTFSTTPAGLPLTLISQVPNNTFFELSGNNLITGSSPTNFETNPSHTVTVRATQGSDTRDETFTITVTDVDEISDLTLSAATIAENSAAGTVVGNLTSTPPGATFSVQAQSPSGTYFVVNGSNQLVAGATPTNFEANSTHSVTIRGFRGSEFFDKVYTITVTDVDEISDITLGANTLNENTAAGVTVGSLTSTPTGATFSLVSQNPAGTFFAVNAGNLVTGVTPTDFETNATHDVTIRGTRLGETFDKTFTITINNVNELTDIALSAATIAENSVQGTNVGTLSSTPAGASWSLTDNAGNRFQLVGSAIQAGSVATNFETATTHDIIVQGTRGADTRTETFTITVTDVDEINDITLSANSIPENSAAATVVGTLSSTPAGATFAITSQTPSGTYFTINGSNQIVAGATPTNFEVNPTHSITIRGTRGSETYDEVFTINVTDVDEISAIALSANSIPENSGAGTVVGNLTSTPTGATFALAPSNTAGTLFAVNGSNQIVAGATATNYETATSHVVTIRGTRLSETFDQAFTVNVTNVQEITDIALSAATMAENSAQGTPVGNLTSTPGGATFTLTDNAGGRFQIVGGQLQAGATNSDYEVATSYQVTVQAALGSDVYSENFTIALTDVSDGHFGNYPDILLGTTTAQAGVASSVGTLYMFPHAYSEDPNTGTYAILSDPSGLFSLTGARSQSLLHSAGVVDGQSYNITVQLTTPSSEVRTAVITVTGIAAGRFRLGGSTFVTLSGPAGGGNSVNAAANGTGGTSPYTYSWTEEGHVPLAFSSTTTANPSVFVASGVGAGFYRGYIYCTATDNVGATYNVIQGAVVQVL